MKDNGWIDGNKMERHGTVESGKVVRNPITSTDEEEEKNKKIKYAKEQEAEDK